MLCLWNYILYICEYINFQNPYIMPDTSSKTTENLDFQPEDSKKIHQSADAESTSKTESNNSNHSDENSRTVTIEIVRHKRLFEILENPRAMWKVIASLFVIVGVFFIGLALVVLVVKSFYPYNVIKTNPYGATIIKNEDKEVIYWLFNTAELWANSGIEVKKNDRITIRASGAANTAIHYLVDGASDDFQPKFSWVGTEGLERNTGHSAFRGKFRLVPDAPFGKLLMQIIPVSKQKNSGKWIKESTYIDGTDEKGVQNHIFTIGKERIELVIPCDGVLHFAVNDVVMSDKNIKDMYLKSLRLFQDSIEEDCKKELQSYIDYFNNTFENINDDKNKNDKRSLKDSIIENNDVKEFLKKYKGGILLKNEYINIKLKNFIDRVKKILKKYKVGILPKDNKPDDKEKEKKVEKKFTRKDLIDSLKNLEYGFGFYYEKGDYLHKGYPFVNELIYYYDNKYRNPWYMDNVGSFLIVIERKTNK